jgi:hypothetical protein
MYVKTNVYLVAGLRENEEFRILLGLVKGFSVGATAMKPQSLDGLHRYHL